MGTNIIMAKFAIAKSKKPSAIEKILAEIISSYPHNIIERPSELSHNTCLKLSISPEAFRRHISTLYKMKLIMKHGNTIIINPSIKSPFKNGK